MANENVDPSIQGFPRDNRDGTPGLVGPDDHTRSLIRARADKVAGQNVAVGNYADLQRMGADAVAGTTSTPTALAKSIDAAPGVNLKDKSIISPAEADAAKGEWTRETERTGLLSAPVPPIPAANTEPNIVDPGAKSPVAEPKKGASK